MTRFNIYTFMFKPINQPDEPELFPTDVDAQESMENKKSIFNGFFHPATDLKFKSRAQTYEHLVVAQSGGVIVLKIANNTHPILENKFTRTSGEDHPSLFVIIDNRQDGKQVIAIENRTQAFAETNTVATIMEETFNRMLHNYKLMVSIRAKYHAHEFWDVVREYNEGIASVKFTFPYPNMPVISDMVGEYYTNLAKRTNSEPVVILNATNKEIVTLDEEDMELLEMIKAASASGKLIMMRPKKARKWRRIGINTMAQEELSDKVLNNLEDQELIPRKWQALIEFLDKIQMVYY